MTSVNVGQNDSVSSSYSTLSRLYLLTHPTGPVYSMTSIRSAKVSVRTVFIL